MQKRNRPQFASETKDNFLRDLKLTVKPILQQHASRANAIPVAKVIVYPLCYVTCWVMLMRSGDDLFQLYGWYACMGFLVTLNVFNIVHDAVHHALFKSAIANKAAGMMLDVMGGNSFVWGKRHVLYHHTFTNIPNWDVDIQQSAYVKFNPRQQHRNYYRFQYLYMPFLYLLYSLNWILLRDFRDYFQKRSVVRSKTVIATTEYVKLFLFKLFYFSYSLALPIVFIPAHTGQIVTGFLLMHACASALTLLVLLPSHLDEHASFPEPDENLMLEDTWAIHQLKVTNDFSTKSPVLNFIMGGLNHHIAHHLFPTVNHNLIPHLTKEIEAAANKRGLPYRCYQLKQVMISHMKLLRKNGQPTNFFQE